MHRFFVSPEELAQSPVVLRGGLAHQIGRVLRCQPGGRITLLDGTGRAALAEIRTLTPAAVTVDVLEITFPTSEPEVDVTLYAALPKGKRFEWVLQKGTEVGVATFVPMVTERAIVPGASEVSESRFERWRRIITEAAEQSGRTRIPQLLAVRPFSEACEAPPPNVLALIPWVDENALSLRAALTDWRLRGQDRPREVRVYTGPEGGFDPLEVALARERGVQPVSLGPRILRAETAAVVAPALVLYDLGEMEPSSPAG